MDFKRRPLGSPGGFFYVPTLLIHYNPFKWHIMRMTKKQYGESLKDPRWQKKRLEILERDNWACQWCGDTETTLHVHHLYYSGSFPWETEDDGLQTLCSECHDINHLNTTDLEKILINAVRGGNMGNSEYIKMMNRVITRGIKDRENG